MQWLLSKAETACRDGLWGRSQHATSCMNGPSSPAHPRGPRFENTPNGLPVHVRGLPLTKDTHNTSWVERLPQILSNLSCTSPSDCPIPNVKSPTWAELLNMLVEANKYSSCPSFWLRINALPDSNVYVLLVLWPSHPGLVMGCECTFFSLRRDDLNIPRVERLNAFMGFLFFLRQPFRNRVEGGWESLNTFPSLAFRKKAFPG